MGDRKWGREYKKLDLSVKFDVLFCYCRYMYDIDWEIYRKNVSLKRPRGR